MAVEGSVRFGNNNFAAADWATVTFSSARSGSPGSNSLDPARFKRWIPGGYFLITASNNLIYINDGSNKTATLTAAGYTSPSALATHVQTQLNAVSSNWTCTYSSSTGKFSIGRSSGTRSLRFSQTASAAWDTLGYTVLVDTDPGISLTAAEVRSHTSEIVDFDFSAPVTPTMFAMFGPADDTVGFSDDATITLKANIANDFTSPGLSLTLTPDQGNLIRFFDGLITTYRYWRLEIEDRKQLNTSGLQICQIYLGDYISPTTRNFSVGFNATLEDPALVQSSLSGVNYYRTLPKTWRFDSLGVQYISGEDRTELIRLFKELGVGTPMVVSLDPLAQVSASVGEFTKYMTFDVAPSMTHILRNLYSIQMALREVVG